MRLTEEYGVRGVGSDVGWRQNASVKAHVSGDSVVSVHLRLRMSFSKVMAGSSYSYEYPYLYSYSYEYVLWI